MEKSPFHSTAEGGDAEELLDRLIERARESGADGIIFIRVDRVNSTADVRVLQVKAVFIKYKKNL